jgi:uncharacterized protein (DUF1330 family)
MSGYVIFQNRIVDQEKMQEYISKVMPTLEPYNAELLVLEEESEVLEGEPPFPRTIVLKFDSKEAASAWYNCAEYAEVRPLRLEATEGNAILCESFALSAG